MGSPKGEEHKVRRQVISGNLTACIVPKTLKQGGKSDGPKRREAVMWIDVWV